MKIKFLGHACLQIETAGSYILVDPFITGNAKAKDVDINALRADYILITHAHQDHVLDVETIAASTGATLISNAEIITYYSQKGLKGHAMNTGGSWNFDFGNLKATIAHHSSSFADGSNGGAPNGYVLKSDGKRIYVAGDTSITYDMKLIPETIGKLDLAVLPIGDNFTMDFKDAAIASDLLQCNKVLGYHYDTFKLIELDHKKALNHFADKNKELILMRINEVLEL